MFFSLSSPVSHFFSIGESVSPHRLPKATFLSLGLLWGTRNASMFGQQTLFSHRSSTGLCLPPEANHFREGEMALKGQAI